MEEKSNNKGQFYFGKNDFNLSQQMGIGQNNNLNKSFNEDFLKTCNKENKNLINIKPLNTFNTYNTFNNHYNIQPFNGIRLNTTSKDYEELTVFDMINKIKVAESNLVIFMIEGIFENVVNFSNDLLKEIIKGFLNKINLNVQEEAIDSFVSEFSESKLIFNKYEQYLHFIKNLHIQITGVRILFFNFSFITIFLKSMNLFKLFKKIILTIKKNLSNSKIQFQI